MRISDWSSDVCSSDLAQAKFEAQIVELQDEAKALPAKAQARVTEALAEANETYTDLVKRGEKAVDKLRKVEVAVDADSKKTKTTVTASVTRATGVHKPAAKQDTRQTAPAAKQPDGTQDTAATKDTANKNAATPHAHHAAT